MEAKRKEEEAKKKEEQDRIARQNRVSVNNPYILLSFFWLLIMFVDEKHCASSFKRQNQR